MLKDLGKGFTQGQYLFYHDKGPVAKGAVTRKFDVCTRESGIIIGQIRWKNHWKKYIFVPINCILDATCMQEIAEFLNLKTTDQKKDWKETNFKFRQKYDMTKRNAQKQARLESLRYNSVVESGTVNTLVGGSIPSAGANLEN